MKKYIFIGVIISSFILGSCNIDWKDENKTKVENLEKQVSGLKKEKSDDVFNKKQECLKLESEIKKQLNEIGKIHGSTDVDEIFYSKKLNSCFYTSKGTNSYIIFNYFNGKFYDGANYSNLEDTRRLNKKIKELKGE